MLPTSRAARVDALPHLQVGTVDAAIRAESGVASDAGAMVVSTSAARAAQLGLRPGDVIVRINNVAIRAADDAARVFQGLRGRQGQIRIVIEREGTYVVGDFLWRG
jgi:C-terminal processing protease CtpA/Prc